MYVCALCVRVCPCTPWCVHNLWSVPSGYLRVYYRFYNMCLHSRRGWPEIDDNGNVMLQSFLSKLFKNISAEDTLVPPLWEKRGNTVF